MLDVRGGCVIADGGPLMASPKAKPAALKLIEGRGHGRDSGGRPVPVTPKFKRLPPTAPEWLPAEAAAEWERVVPELARLELTKPVDRAALTAYCLAWDRLVEAQRLVTEEGVLGENSQGRVRHPAVAVVEAASKELRAWAGEFGFTPSAENKLTVQGADDGEDDPFA
jgi:P27 family predicted phage terminase small subunit